MQIDVCFGKCKGYEGHDCFCCFLNKWDEESVLSEIILFEYYFSYPDSRILEPPCEMRLET